MKATYLCYESGHRQVPELKVRLPTVQKNGVKCRSNSPCIGESREDVTLQGLGSTEIYGQWLLTVSCVKTEMNQDKGHDQNSLALAMDIDLSL